MRVLVLAASLLAAACQTVTPPILNPNPAPESKGLERERWMFEQRAYPFGTIPAGARRIALDEARRAAVETLSSDATAGPYWRPVGPLPVETYWPWGAATGRVKALAVSPANPGLVLAGSSSGGIWRSTDGGRNFTPVSDNHADLAVGAIAFAPSNPSLVYAAMGSDFLGSGMLRSTDAGATWRLVSGPTFSAKGTTPRIVIDPVDPQHLWAAQYSRLDQTSGNTFSSGILESRDGGATWTNLFRGLTTDLVALPGSTSTFLIGVLRADGEGAGNAGIYRTTNGGASWSLVFNLGDGGFGYPRITVSPAAPQRAYAHLYRNGPGGPQYQFLVSEDGGSNWTEPAATGLAEDFSVFAHADPANADVVYVGMRDLYKSSDGGKTFRNMTRGYTPRDEFDPENSTSHVDQHSLAFHPTNTSTLYLGNDGGVFLSANGAETFQSLSGTLSLVQAYSIAAHPTDPKVLFLGTQDNGLERNDANGKWRELITGDYGSILFDKRNTDRLVSNYVRGYILSFAGRGETYLDTITTTSTFGEDERIAFIAPFEQSRLSNTLYFGTSRLFVSRDFGVTWTPPAGSLDLTTGSTDTLAAIGVAPSDESTIYTGSNRGRLMVTRDGGATWTPSSNLPNRAVRAIAVDPLDPNVAYAGFSGYAAQHVWVTRNGGSSWQSMSAGLPDIPVNALLLADTLYAGTDIGVFRFDGTRWNYFSTGMPPVIVTDFDVTANGTIVAATHGRGAYELVTAAAGNRRRTVRH